MEAIDEEDGLQVAEVEKRTAGWGPFLYSTLCFSFRLSFVPYRFIIDPPSLIVLGNLALDGQGPWRALAYVPCRYICKKQSCMPTYLPKFPGEIGSDLGLALEGLPQSRRGGPFFSAPPPLGLCKRMPKKARR